MKVFIVDDEPIAREELAYLLQRTKKVIIQGMAANMEEALDSMKMEEVDVIFLDIQLEEGTGIEIAEELRHFDHHPEIVFATAYDEYALKAFELEAIDYILKPFEDQRIQHTVEKLLKHIELVESNAHEANATLSPSPEMTGKLAITVNDRIVLLSIDDILYIETEQGKTIITTEKKRYELAEPLTTLEKKLENSVIRRVHRSYLVNLQCIVEIQPWFHSTYNLIMKDGKSLPVSRTYAKELKKMIGF
ncbi:response regulator transcription factor [Bacillaceae bacterium Marseille-Q3522]|nr:response regulator transcription factor [Bacillaceae bacterium Marseille-Q3522]